jgi:CHAT domain-containing protein
LLLALAVLFETAGCQHGKPFSPEQTYQNLWLQLRRGETAAALAGADSALRAVPSRESEWYWRFTALKAEILEQQRLNKEALALLQPELPASLASSDIAVWRKMTEGAASGFQQQFADGERFLNEAEALARSSHPELLGEIFLRKGTLSFLRGDYLNAQSNYHSSLLIARQQKDLFLEAASLGSLGLVSERTGHYDESIDWYREALSFSQSVGAQGSTTRIQGNMGWSYFQMGDFESALVLYQQAEKASRERGLKGDQLHWLINIGNADYELHDYVAAENIWEQALRLARSQDNKREVTRCLNNLSQANLETGRTEIAQQYAEEAAGLERAASDERGVLYSMVVAGRIAMARQAFPAAEKAFKTVIQNPLVDISLKWEAQARLGQLLRAQGQPAGADHQFLESIRTIEHARKSITREESRLSFLSAAVEFYDEYVDFLISQGRIVEALQVSELSRARVMAEGLGINSSALSFPMKRFNPTQTARRLNTVMLSYWLGPHHSYMWVVTATKISSFTLPPTSEIDALVQTYRKVLVGPRDAVETQNAEGKKLYDVLIGPAIGLIPQNSRVTMLPDNSLYGLNFEALIVSAPKTHYWIEDVTLTTANSLVLLAASSSTFAPRTKNLLLIGNTIEPNAEFPRLPQAAVEMSRVEQYFSRTNRTILSGDKATPPAYFESNPGQFSYVHFVTHGTASRTTPLDSAVILTKVGDSYKLYARDIISRPLRADLVTISACRGAGERTYSGEGLVGLTWAFLRAGAHSVIAALWEVNDNSTPQLMDQLYWEISKGTSPDAALRDAKLSLIHSGTVYRKPFYWAPFQIYHGS